MEQKIKNRYVILTAGMLIQLCSGIIYMWGVFKKPVAQYLEWDKAALTSSIMLCAFVAGIVVGGLAQDKLGPKIVVFAGSVLTGAGMLLTSLVNSSAPALLYLTYGVIGGFGVGTLYTTTVTIVQKWYPDRRGFATGMMVSAFGFSLVIFAPLATALLSSKGVPFTFVVIGILFLAVCCVCSMFISNPPAGWAPSGFTAAKNGSAQRHYRTSEMLKTKQFYLMAFSMLFLLPAFFIINPILITLGMERGLSEKAALLGVMITGIASATGRLTFSWLSDLIGRKGSILSMIAITFLFVLLLIPARGVLYLVCIAAIAFAFGGSAGVYPVMAADNYGTKYGGLNYGCVMVGFGISALVFPVISNNLANYTLSFTIAAAACVISFVLVVLIKKPE